MKDKIKKYYKELKDGTKNMFKEFFNKETNKKQRANMWTFLRLILPIFIILLTVLSLSLNLPFLFTMGGIVAGFGGLTDFFDGRSARKYNSTSEYGKKLDQFTDKVFAGAIAINISIINPMYISLLIGEALIAIVNLTFKSKFNYINDNSSKIGKIKQWPLFASLFLGFSRPTGNIVLNISKILCAITVVLQTLTIVDYTSKHIKTINKKEKEIKNMPHSLEIYTFEEEKNNNLSKEKTINKKQVSKKDELIKLRNVLLNIKLQKEETENKIDEINSKQKVIKL